MKKRLIFVFMGLILFAFGFAQTGTPWVGKYKLAFDTNDNSIIYLQIVPDNTGTGDIADGVAYLKFPPNTGYTATNVNGIWEVKTLTFAFPNLTLPGGTDCGMVIECQMLSQYPATNNQATVTFTQGVPVNLVKFQLSSSNCAPGATYRLYDNQSLKTDPCVDWDQYFLDNGMTVEANSGAYTGNLTTWQSPLVCTNMACAWRSTKVGNWTDNTVWQYFDCDLKKWVDSPVSPNNDRPIYVLHNVTIPTGTNITADSLYIQPDGKLNACGSLTIDNEIAFVLDASGNPGELNNCGCPGGTVELNSTARKIVHRPAGSAWSFMSFPFDVKEENIFLSDTKVYDPTTLVDNYSYKTATPATWGNLADTGKDFYALEYDGQKQANDDAANLNPKTSNFVNVIGTTPTRVFKALTGYLISNTPSNLKAIDFTSELGEDFDFCTPVNKPLTYYTATGAEICSQGYNFVGLPYVASYDLNNAASTPASTYYVYEAPNYVEVVSGQSKTLYPFSAYFVQVNPTATNLVYAAGGQQLIKGVNSAANFDEISLELMFGTNVDRTRIRLQENAVNDFVYTEDAFKMMSPSATYPQIYTIIEGACDNIAVNALPESTRQVELKIRTGVKGFYTIRLTAAEKAAGLSNVILVDRETGLRTDLMTVEGYEFEVTTTGVSDRFYVLLSNDQTTQANRTSNSGISINTKGKHVTISGLKGTAHVNMFDVVGKLIYQYPDIKDEQSFDVDIPGVYMMDISTETQKARIKVLINKKN